MPSTLTEGLEWPELAASLVSTAKMAAPLGSPINSTPCGPKASGPDDLSSTFPRCSDFGASAPTAVAATAPRAIPIRAFLNCIGCAFPERCSASFRGALYQYAHQARCVNHAESAANLIAA